MEAFHPLSAIGAGQSGRQKQTGRNAQRQPFVLNLLDPKSSRSIKQRECVLSGRIRLEPIVSWSMRRAPTILFTLSVIVLAIGLAVAFMSANFTGQQVTNAAPSGTLKLQANGVVRIQLLHGIGTALQNALWPFAAGALVRAVQLRPAA